MALVNGIVLIVGGGGVSTEEQLVGTWIDGKPLYQKTFVKTNGVTPRQLYFTSDFANMDYIQKVAFANKNNISGTGYESEYYGAYNDFLFSIVVSGGVYLVFENRTVYEMYITVQYTKRN